MQVLTVGYASNGRGGYNGRSWGRQCKHCKKVLREGERVLKVSQRDYVHVRCVWGLIGGEPDCMSPEEWLNLNRTAKAERKQRELEERALLDEEFLKARDELIRMLNED